MLTRGSFITWTQVFSKHMDGLGAVGHPEFTNDRGEMRADRHACHEHPLRDVARHKTVIQEAQYFPLFRSEMAPSRKPFSDGLPPRSCAVLANQSLGQHSV